MVVDLDADDRQVGDEALLFLVAELLSNLEHALDGQLRAGGGAGVARGLALTGLAHACGDLAAGFGVGGAVQVCGAERWYIDVEIERSKSGPDRRD